MLITITNDQQIFSVLRTYRRKRPREKVTTFSSLFLHKNSPSQNILPDENISPGRANVELQINF